MKNILILFLTIISFTGTDAQNVGIGTNSPSQRLDVAGNINTTGNLMVNGVAGTNGQVLGMNGGSMQWMNKSRFGNWAIFSASGTFTVPAGVNEVLIEMWGAGGGAHNPGGGGGSGGYWIGLVPVTGVSAITLTVGVGGTGGGVSAGGSGGATSFNFTNFFIRTGGGNGADSSLSVNFEDYGGGAGGPGLQTFTAPATFTSYYYLNGMDGTPTTVTFIQGASSVFYKVYTGGVGGVAPFSGQHTRAATSFISIPGVTADIRSIHNGATGPDFGSGGTPDVLTGTSGGGPGRVIIYY